MAIGGKQAPGKDKPKKSPTKTSAKTSTSENVEGVWRIEDDGSKVRNTRALPYENKLREVLTEAGTLITLGDEFVGVAVVKKAPELAYGYAKLAQEDERVRKVLKLMLEGSAWADAIFPTLSLAIVVLWHFGIFVPDKLGVPMALSVVGVPMSREVEQEMKKQRNDEARQAAVAEQRRQETVEAENRSGTASAKEDREFSHPAEEED